MNQITFTLTSILLWASTLAGLTDPPLANEELGARAISDGDSMNPSHTILRGNSSDVVLENWTRFPLDQSQCQSFGGTATCLAVSVLPAKREVAMQFDKCGTSGVASWTVDTLPQQFTFAWNVSETSNTSWMAIGIFTNGSLSLRLNDVFMQMKSGENSTDLLVLHHTFLPGSRDTNFVMKLWDARSNFYIRLLIPKDNMEQSLVAKLNVFPSRYEDLAKPIREALDREAPVADSLQWQVGVKASLGVVSAEANLQSSGYSARPYHQQLMPFPFIVLAIKAVFLGTML